MALDPQERQELRLYLLGRLEPEGRLHAVEERMLTEPEYYEELLIAEDEVVDAYVNGALGADERERFEQHFLVTPERRRKLRFARALSGYVARASESHATKPAWESRAAKAAGRGLLPAFLRPLFATPLRAAAVALLLVACVLLGLRLYDRTDPAVREGLEAMRRAYENTRPFESRITDWQYAPWSVTRGGDARTPDALLLKRAELRLHEAVERSPGPESRQALGRFYLAQKQFAQATPLLEEALKEDGDDASLHNDLGVALLEQVRAERERGAGEPSEKSFETLARSADHFERAVRLDPSFKEAHFNRAISYQEMLLWRQAEEAWREYLRLDATSPWADEARKNLKQLEEGGRAASPDAGESLKAFLAAARSADDEAAWKVVGRTYTSAGNVVTNRLLDAELGLEAPGDTFGQEGPLPALTYLARLEREKDGDLYTSDVLNHYRRATPPQREQLREARALLKTGYELFKDSKWAAAVAEYEKAREAFERAGDAAGRAFVDYRLAHCRVFMPDSAKARADFERLAALTEASRYRWLHAHALYGLAHVHINSNEFSRAAEYSGRALSAFERAGDFNGVLRALVQLADVNRDLNRTGRALAYLQRGLTLMSEGPADPQQRWGLLVQVAMNLSSRRLNTAALFYQKEALGVALDMKRPLLVSRSYGYVGTAFASLKMYAEALESATRAFEIGRGMAREGAEIVANASLQSGDILRESGQCGLAVEAYDRSLQLYGEQKDEYYRYAAHRGKLLCFMDAGDDAAAGSELRAVLELFDRYRSKITAESQRNSFFDKHQGVYDLAIRYGYERLRDPAAAFEYSEQSRARSLLELMRRGGEVLDEGGAPDLSLSAETRPLSLEELRAGLPEGARVLQYAVLEDRVLIWVLSKTGLQAAEAPVGAQELTEKVRDYLAAASAPPAGGEAALAALSSDLYRLLVAPAEPHLRGAKFVCLVPDKVLHYLPFVALVSPASGKYLMEEYELGMAPSSSIFVAQTAKARERAARGEEHLLSVGEASFDRAAFPGLPSLPSAAKEAADVSGFYDAGRRLLLRSDAFEQAVKSELPKADVAHFAMHYVVNESSEMLSGFPLAPARAPGGEAEDGFLQSYEIYKMSLPRTRLVVLSACRTGIEQQYGGEGAVGVARPFLVAGVPLVVASLWPVDTDASAELMVGFHRQRRRAGVPATEALRRAQIEMARGPDARYRHPYYWAPFVAIGGRTSF